MFLQLLWAPSIYIEVVLPFLIHITLLFLDFDSLVRAGVLLPWHCWHHLRGFPVYWTVPVLGYPVFQDLTHHWLPTLKEISLQRHVIQGGDEEQPTGWSHGSLPFMLSSLPWGRDCAIRIFRSHQHLEGHLTYWMLSGDMLCETLKIIIITPFLPP